MERTPYEDKVIQRLAAEFQRKGAPMVLDFYGRSIHPSAVKIKNGKKILLCTELVETKAHFTRVCRREGTHPRRIGNHVEYFCRHHAAVWDAFWEAALTGDFSDPILQQVQTRGL